MNFKLITIQLFLTSNVLALEEYSLYKRPTNFFEVGFCGSYICDLVFLCLLILATLFFPVGIKTLRKPGESTAGKLLLPLAALSFLLACLGTLLSILDLPTYPPHLNFEALSFQQKLGFFYENLVYIIYTSIFALSMGLFYVLLHIGNVIKLSKEKKGIK